MADDVVRIASAVTGDVLLAARKSIGGCQVRGDHYINVNLYWKTIGKP